MINSLKIKCNTSCITFTNTIIKMSDIIEVNDDLWYHRELRELRLKCLHIEFSLDRHTDIFKKILDCIKRIYEASLVGRINYTITYETIFKFKDGSECNEDISFFSIFYYVLWLFPLPKMTDKYLMVFDKMLNYLDKLYENYMKYNTSVFIGEQYTEAYRKSYNKILYMLCRQPSRKMDNFKKIQLITSRIIKILGDIMINFARHGLNLYSRECYMEEISNTKNFYDTTDDRYDTSSIDEIETAFNTINETYDKYCKKIKFEINIYCIPDLTDIVLDYFHDEKLTPDPVD